MLEISRREGALQRLPTNIGVREEIFLDETLPRPSLCYGWGFTPWMTRKGTIEASTFGRGGSENSLLAQQLYVRRESLDSLCTANRVCLATILFTDKALPYLGAFSSMVSHLFSSEGRHTAAVA